MFIRARSILLSSFAVVRAQGLMLAALLLAAAQGERARCARGAVQRACTRCGPVAVAVAVAADVRQVSRCYYTRALMSATAEKARLDDNEPIEGIQENMARQCSILKCT